MDYTYIEAFLWLHKYVYLYTEVVFVVMRGHTVQLAQQQQRKQKKGQGIFCYGFSNLQVYCSVLNDQHMDECADCSTNKRIYFKKNIKG